MVNLNDRFKTDANRVSAAMGLFQAQALGKWSYIPKKCFAPFGDKCLCFFSNLRSHAFKGLQLTTSYLLELCVKNVARLELSRPVNFVMEQQPH